MAFVYLCPLAHHPIGGVKVIYKHAEALMNAGIEAYIHHPEDRAFKCTWFDHKVKFRTEEVFATRGDFIIIPEVWAPALSSWCIENNLPYAIFVQNGYYMNAKMGKERPEFSELSYAYERANYILSISEDTSKLLTLTFPKVDPKKIIRLLPSVASRFQPGEKNKTISFMPRKLPWHAGQVQFFLREYLPENWAMAPIDKKNEVETAEILSSSSIFLSFCEQEGCPLPPLEAAFSGNIVVGYTGQGANEYFAKPIFRTIENGDFHGFTKAIVEAIADIEAGLTHSHTFKNQFEVLRKNYSNETEYQMLFGFAKKAQELAA
jgi:hypothetical protein